MKKTMYAFHEGTKEMIDLLGGKGAGLAEMVRLGLPVPPGFTITTQACEYYLEHHDYPKDFEHDLEKQLAALEQQMGQRLGDGNADMAPLLLSVRSGAAVSMPGMMDTVLNLGLNDETVETLRKKTGNDRFCYDAYRRFVAMFGDVVMNVPHELFEAALEALKEREGVTNDTDISAEGLAGLVGDLKKIVQKESGRAFPGEPREQLKLAVEAVFSSWNNARAVRYRKLHGITGLKGTAVTVQAMVFGNMGETSGTGVCFTRNPSSGDKELYGEFLMNAQGEDVVAGLRTPQKIHEMKGVLPQVFDELTGVMGKLENHYRDMQDIEFTVQEGTLYLLQTRSGKRTSRASLKVACDLVEEGLITREEAVLRIDAARLGQLLHPELDPAAEKNVVAKGLPAGPGAACGKVVFTADDAFNWTYERNEKVILVRRETSPEDIHGMHAAQGILTSTGGMTSHAAVVARGMGRCCVAGCSGITVDSHSKTLRIGELEIKEGDVITLDGSSGEVLLGEVPMVEPAVTDDFKKILDWSRELKTMKVRVNADSPDDARVGLDFGAEGIGLCRTEHMFFDDDRVNVVRKMILAQSEKERQAALDQLLPMQQKDFLGMFEVMDGLPVTIRLLDPPLHEFLPQTPEQMEEMAGEMGLSVEAIEKMARGLHETNPMLGHRGLRLGMTHPEIYAMQVRAIAQAALEAAGKGVVVKPEIELPFVSHVNELKAGRAAVEKVLAEFEEGGVVKNGGKGEIVVGGVSFKIGTMIELPRACLTADELAPHADFFSFGTNDLTQTTWGYSRDDAGKFLNTYLEQGVLLKDPMASLDEAGVGKLMETCVKLSRPVASDMKKNLEIGICGEQAGDPASVDICQRIGLDFVSCSPYRVPIATVAAAQAALRQAGHSG